MGNNHRGCFSKRTELWACLLSRHRCSWGSPAAGKTGQSVQMHMNLHWEKKPRGHSAQPAAGAWEGEHFTDPLCPGAGPGQPLLAEPQQHLGSRGAQGLHGATAQAHHTGREGCSAIRGEHSAPAIPHLRTLKMPLWESKRKIKGKPEQGIALSEVTTFIVTFVLHRLVHHRGFFIPSFFSW